MSKRLHKPTVRKPVTVTSTSRVSIASPRSHRDASSVGTAPLVPSRRRPWELVAVGLALVMVFLWANWPALVELVQTWDREPDYSHGYLVAPIAALFLWFRRDRFPRHSLAPGWGGFVLLTLSILLA